jgi:hypothetical protein
MLAAFCSFMYFSFCKRGFAALCKYRKLSLSLNNIAIYTCIIVGTFIFGKKKKIDQEGSCDSEILRHHWHMLTRGK